MTRFATAMWLVPLIIGIAPVWARMQEAFPDRKPVVTAPYLDDLLSKLQKVVPELKGLAPAANQEQLPALLQRTGDAIQSSEKELPNLISRELVVQTRVTANPLSYGGSLNSEQRREFNYLILSHREQGAMNVLEEYRTDLKNRRIDPTNPDAGAPKGQGFSEFWLLFAPSHRSESNFRYLGEQKLEKHKTAFVIAFAQKPDVVRVPGEILLQGKLFPVWYQGIAWIDESSFQIMRMRTDLLEPRADIHLQRLTSVIQFGEVRIPKMTTTLMLPTEVEITLEINTEVSKEVHTYSDYRLYKVETRIIP